MKKCLIFLLLMLFALPSMATERKKVGLVLGGGGAKGVSHIGVLKVLEEAGIPVDYIAGTSMGAIVGGLYAIGYAPAEIDSMVSSLDWQMLLSDKVKRSNLSFPEKENAERYIISLPFGKEKKGRYISGVIKGQNLQNLFSNLTIGYHDSVDFNSFHIPFACVALDIVDGHEQVFHRGSLPTAMRASMAIPAVFTPVRLDSMVLVDGGLLNNYPADVARNMGADIIIGVDLGTSDLKDFNGINTPSDVVGQIVGLYGFDKYKANKDSTDILIRPNTVPYNSASFSPAALDTLIDRGEQAARKQWDKLMALKQEIGITEKPNYRANTNTYPVSPSDTLYIRHIHFEGIDPRDQKWLTDITRLKENSTITIQQLQQAMAILVGTNAYSNVSYKLTGERQDNLVFTVQEKSISSINVGLRFDTEEIVAVLLNATLDYRARYHSKLAFTGRVGKKSYAKLDYTIERSPLRHFDLAYMFTYQDLDIYNRGEKIFNTSYRHHWAEFGYTDVNWLNFKFQAGVRYDYFDYNSFLYTGEDQRYEIRPEGFISYFALAHLETLDRQYFPSKGVSLKADYSIYTSNFVNYKGHTPFSALGLQFQAVLPVTSHFSLIPSVYGRVMIGRNIAYPFKNVVGGEVSDRYLAQQLPFAGISHIEIFDNTVTFARLHFRQRISQNNYISLIANYGITDDNFFNLFKGQHIFGGSLGYAYNSFAGPLSANFSMSNRNNNLQFYMSLGYYF
ncbi:patatin-like phospholipase family protein [Parabacteroides bouchesdurhonensis]|uniref:patatin-like phospholipase family protein n=1 Tax=Parabacteroides bouchesdurhonensis TaxID=1936995 RepID=UPI000C851D08|nr:patatin-like phospholipase family protein [Parabacteroides bouchesdurhonensis]